MRECGVSGLDSVIYLVGNDPTLSLLSLRRSRDVACLRYGGTDLLFICYDFKTGLSFDVPSTSADNRLKIVSASTVNVPDRETRWLREIQLASIYSCKSNCHELGSVVKLSGDLK